MGKPARRTEKENDMSQVYPGKYRYQVCPHCKSKKTVGVALTKLHGGVYSVENAINTRTGYLCENCKRYHTERETKYMTDQAEMRRDVEHLTAYLQGERK